MILISNIYLSAPLKKVIMKQRNTLFMLINNPANWLHRLPAGLLMFSPLFFFSLSRSNCECLVACVNAFDVISLWFSPVALIGVGTFSRGGRHIEERVNHMCTGRVDN